ncbi:hypothetical protein HaLaN_32449 [Haematococcus lacustris]|uniref:Uncharacterized protein n=1 Tax=Haematococcus lacustris TaxID=44745 RepID=A0A6A0AJY2_HAELA|nr:hypothetical protein HaLaN_32449 [Haematococcus lacustris]
MSSARYKQYDGIIVADECILVVEAAAAGAPDIAFARRADGSVKDIKGALGGLRIVADDQNEGNTTCTCQMESASALGVPGHPRHWPHP